MGTFSDGESGSSVRTKINAAIEKTEGTSAISTVDINGGAIDGVTLGTNSAVTDLRVDNIKVDSNEISATNTNGNVQVTPNGTGVVEVKGAGGNDGTLQLNCSVNSHGVKIKSPPHSAGASYTLTLPNNDGDASQFLQTDGSGTLSWAAAGGTGVTVHTNQAAMLTDAASASEGSLHYDTDANKLYVKQTSGFFLLATITNTTPTITSFSENTGGAGANNLTTGGTFGLTAGSNTVITINATDPDLETLVYSATVTSGTASDVISSPSLPISNQSGNTFTLVPVTSGSGGTITVRFDVSDGNNIANVTQSFSIAFSIADSNFTRLLMATDNAVGGNQSITDSSSTAHTITVTNHSLAGSFSPYRHGGYSTHFNGSTDYLTIADNAEHDFGTGEFSIEFFWKPETLTGNTSNIHIAISTGNDSSTQLIYHESNYWYFQGGSAGAVIINSSGTGAATVGQWNHVVLCRTGTTLSIFHNGTRTATATSSYDTDFSNATIGRYYGSSANYYIDGLVRDMRWLKGSSAYDATQSSITVPTEPLTAVTNTKLLLCHLPYIADGSSTGHTITLSGSTHTRASSPYNNSEYSESTNGGSVFFDGNGDYLSVADHSDFDLTSDFTIKFWARHNYYYAQNLGYIYGYFGNFYSAGGLALSVRGANSDGVVFSWMNSSGTLTNTNLSFYPKLDQWYFYELTRSSNTLTIKANGTSIHSVDVSTLGNPSRSLILGNIPSGASGVDTFGNLFGYVADFQYVTGGTAPESTVPTAQTSTDSNSGLHIKGTDAHVLDKSQVNNLQLIDGAAASTTQAKFASTASVYFDGSDDYVQTPTSSIYNLGTNQFTVEFFFRTEVDAQGSLVYFMNDSTSVLGIFYWHTYNSLALYDSDWITGNDGSGSNYNSISTSTWHYGAITRDTSTLRVFIDGTQVHSGSNTTNYTTNNVRIGRHHSGAYLNGYIQDLRISIGKARYTGSSHTVPTSSLKG